jgi:tetratricopeptide (TPR) repeat protein
VLGCLGVSVASTNPASGADPVAPARALQSKLTATPDDALLRARRLLLERAKERYEAGRGTGEEARQQLEGALDALALAYRLVPAPWLLFNLAQVKSRLGACGEATELYRRFLASNPAANERANAEQALKLLGTCAEPSAPEAHEGLAPGLRPPTALASLVEVEGRLAPAALSDLGAEPALADAGFAGWPWIFGGLALGSAIAGAFFYGEAVDAKHDLDRLQVGGPLVAQTQQRGESALSAAQVLGGFSVGFAVAAGASLLPRSQPGEAPPGASAPLGRLRALPLGAGASYSFEF